MRSRPLTWSSRCRSAGSSDGSDSRSRRGRSFRRRPVPLTGPVRCACHRPRCAPSPERWCGAPPRRPPVGRAEGPQGAPVRFRRPPGQAAVRGSAQLQHAAGHQVDPLGVAPAEVGTGRCAVTDEPVLVQVGTAFDDPAIATITGAPHVSPPSVDRLTATASPQHSGPVMGRGRDQPDVVRSVVGHAGIAAPVVGAPRRPS